MTLSIPLRCRCGSVRGSISDVSLAEAKRAICYCDDCQTYALHLRRPDVLDERGGTDSLVVAPAQVTFEKGADHLSCLRLSPNGPYRWYAGCCDTPLANTPRPAIPFVIVLRAAMDFIDGETADRTLGPVAFGIHGRFAKGGVPEGAYRKVSLSVMSAFVGMFVRELLRGRRRPSPFFDPRDAPVTEPRIIDKSEREALRAQVHAARA